MKILFVCTGNTCRSSMAEGIFAKLIEGNKERYKDLQILSAGISAVNGVPASEFAIKVLKEEGIDISGHTAKQLTSQMINEADLILTMTTAHKNMITSMLPNAKKKTYTLKEFALKNLDINDTLEELKTLDIIDPYGMPYSRYRECAKEIRKVLKKIIDKI